MDRGTAYRQSVCGFFENFTGYSHSFRRSGSYNDSYFRITTRKENKQLYVNTDLSRERLEEFKQKITLDNEKAEAKKAMKAARKEASQKVAPSILGESSYNSKSDNNSDKKYDSMSDNGTDKKDDDKGE